MTPDDKLQAFLAADAAPASDPAFAARVAEAVARRRLRTALGWSAGLALALTLFAWALAPVMADVLPVLSTQGLPLAALVVVLGALSPRIARWITTLAPTRS